MFGKGMRSTEALKEQNIGAFAAELIYASNKEGFSGNDVRNMDLAKDILASTPPEQAEAVRQQFQQHLDVIGAEQIAKVEQRLEKDNKEREKAGDPPLETPKFGKGEVKGTPPPNTVGAAGGAVQVRAHTRDGVPVRAHTRSAP